MVANEEPKEMPIWCETDSDEEQEECTEGTETALVVLSEADTHPNQNLKKEPSFLDPATKILDKTIKVPNCREFICYETGDSSYTHLPPVNPFSKPKLSVDKNEGKSKVTKKKKTSESTVSEYVPIEVLEEMNEMCKEYEKLQVLNKKILSDLQESQTANSALTSEVATLKKDLEELNLLRDEKIAFEILCGKLNAQLESKQKTIDEMSNTLRSLNNSKAAVETLLQSQKCSIDQSGLGHKTSSVQTTSTTDTNQSSGCDLDILKDLLPEVPHDPAGKDYSKVQHEYPKRTGKKKGKT